MEPNTVPEENVQTPSSGRTPKKRRGLVITGAVVGALLVTGGVTAAVSVTNYNAETERLCTVAVKDYDAAVAGTVTDAREAADAALKTSTDKAIKKAVPGATAYSKRPEVKANEKKKIEARPAAADLIAAVKDVRAGLEGVDATQPCESRGDVDELTDTTKALAETTGRVTAATDALNADVKTFSKSEKKRVAAEKAAAEKAAAEAAAAEQAAAEQAAAEAAAAQTYTYDPAPQGGGGGYNPAPPPVQAPPAPSGGDGGGGGGGGGTFVPTPSDGNQGCPPGVNCTI